MRSSPATSSASGIRHWRAATACARAPATTPTSPRWRRPTPLSDPCRRALQRPGPGQHRRHSSSAGRRPVQRRLQRSRSRMRWRMLSAAAWTTCRFPLVLSWYEQRRCASCSTRCCAGIRVSALGSYALAFVSPGACYRCWWTTTVSAPAHPPGRPCTDRHSSARSFPFGRDSSEGWKRDAVLLCSAAIRSPSSSAWRPSCLQAGPPSWL